MLTIELDIFQSCALGAIVLWIGKLIKSKVDFLNKYCIPAPVVGGTLFALLHLSLYATGTLEIVFDTTLQTVFMSIFYCSVGYSACFRLIKKGGAPIFLLLTLTVVMCAIQDIVGVSLAKVFGLEPLLGLCMGSMPLVGGHGTSGSFGPFLEENNAVIGAATVALASATYGLVGGSMMGGPIARARVERKQLKPTEDAVQIQESSEIPVINKTRFTNAAIFLAVAIGVGTFVYAGFKAIGLTFPTYMGAMLCGAIFRNVFDLKKDMDLPLDEIDTIGELSLNLYLAMAMMALKLWQLAALALPMIIILLIQTVIVALYANFAVFNIMGRDYEAAAFTTAFCGFAMGATPNAMANMKTLVDRYGPAPKAFFVVPIVGSLFIDFFNSLILMGFINVFG